MCRPIDRGPVGTVTSGSGAAMSDGVFTALVRGLRWFLSRYGPDCAHMAWTYHPVSLGDTGGPGPGHPEKLASHIPMSEVERGLWRQLSHF
jgi:hypothetical protein